MYSTVSCSFVSFVIEVYSAGHCLGRYLEMWEGDSAIRKINCTGPWKLATIPLYNPLKSPVGTHVHKTMYGPLIDRALYVELLSGQIHSWRDSRLWELDWDKNIFLLNFKLIPFSFHFARILFYNVTLTHIHAAQRSGSLSTITDIK